MKLHYFRQPSVDGDGSRPFQNAHARIADARRACGRWGKGIEVEFLAREVASGIANQIRTANGPSSHGVGIGLVEAATDGWGQVRTGFQECCRVEAPSAENSIHDLRRTRPWATLPKWQLINTGQKEPVAAFARNVASIEPDVEPVYNGKAVIGFA